MFSKEIISIHAIFLIYQKLSLRSRIVTVLDEKVSEFNKISITRSSLPIECNLYLESLVEL